MGLKACLLLLAAPFGLMKYISSPCKPYFSEVTQEKKKRKRKEDKEILEFIGTATLLPVVHCPRAEFQCTFE